MVEIPVTCYQILGIIEKAEKDEIVKAAMELKNAEIENGYTAEVSTCRQALLVDVRDKLLFEQEYAGSIKEKVPPRSSLHIPWSWLLASLCVLTLELVACCPVCLAGGMLYLIQRETQTTLPAALFKVLILLISATPYACMPKDLFPTIMTAMCSRLLDRHSNKIEHYALLVNVLNCLEAAFSKVPPSSNVFGVIVQDGCGGSRQSYVSKCMRSHSIEKRSTELDAVEEENEMKDENQNKEPLVLTKLSLRNLRAKLKETLLAHEEPLVSTKLSLRKLRAKLKETLIAHEGKEAKRVALTRLDNKSAIILTRRNS